MKSFSFAKYAIIVSMVVFVHELYSQDAISKDSNINLIENWGFEQGTSSWNFTHRAIGNDENSFTEGKQSLKVDGSGKPEFIYGLQSITIKLKPSTEYVFKVDIKRSSPKGTVMASAVEKARKDLPDWVYHTCELSQGTLDKWEHLSIKFKTGDEVADAAIILYNINSEGIAWFDNLTLVEIK